MALFKKPAAIAKKAEQAKKQKKVTAKQASYDFVKAAKEFEISRVEELEKSKSLAWKVAFGACALAIVCAVALMMLTPFKEVRPYVIRVDNNTGETDIVTMLDNSKSDYGEEVAKYFSAMYVNLYESYEWYTIQKQIDQLMLFSDRNIQSRINTKFAKPDAPHKIYKDSMRVLVKINNTSILDEQGLIQVRFTKTVEPVSGGTYNHDTGRMSPEPMVTERLATLGYEYGNLPTLDDVRLINPLGFTVKSYRVDEVMGE